MGCGNFFYFFQMVSFGVAVLPGPSQAKNSDKFRKKHSNNFDSKLHMENFVCQIIFKNSFKSGVENSNPIYHHQPHFNKNDMACFELILPLLSNSKLHIFIRPTIFLYGLFNMQWTWPPGDTGFLVYFKKRGMVKED